MLKNLFRGRSRKPSANRERWKIYENEMWGLGHDYYKSRIHKFTVKTGILLDIGCGPGQWCAAAAEAGIHAIGVDKKISRRTRDLNQSIRQFSLVLSDAEYLPFKNKVFHIILCELVFPYINIEKCVAEISRVIQQGGLVHGICHGPGYYLMQAVNEAMHFKINAIRRLLVIIYTMMHRNIHCNHYFYETYQRGIDIRRIFENCGLDITSITPGGHPIIREKSFLGLTTFFEFMAIKK
jgi:ubiquinone/menaquinone biosynthesis C-methylase UbiE